MKYFVVNVSGYEEYSPEWFSTDYDYWTNENFEAAVRCAVEEALPKLLEIQGYICGHEVLDAIVPLLQENGLKRLKPNLEISLKGECIYRDSECKYNDERPEVFSDNVWSEVLKHNAEVTQGLYDDDELDSETED